MKLYGDKMRVMRGTFDVDRTLETAKKLGFECIDNWDSNFRISKQQSKIGNTKDIQATGTLFLVGKEDSVRVVIVSGQLGDWIKTSPVLSIAKDGDLYVIETQNSIYHLQHVSQ